MALFKKTSCAAAAAAALISFLSCTANVSLDQGLINRLKNRGPIALSSENPYLAANLLVAKEAEKSKVIRGFVKYRGAPRAIEVRKDVFRPLKFNFFYPESREYFALESIGETWIVDGPKRIPDEIMPTVAKLTRNIKDEPLLAIGRTEQAALVEKDTFAQNTAGPWQDTKPALNGHTQLEANAEDSFIARLNKIEQDADKNAAPAVKSKPPKRITAQSSQKTKAENSDLEMIRELQQRQTSDKSAEVTPNGDVVHYVTYPGENLSMIARWYTHDRNNIGRLSRLNELDDPNALQIGDMIVIPSYLVKNTHRLTKGAIDALKGKKFP